MKTVLFLVAFLGFQLQAMATCNDAQNIVVERVVAAPVVQRVVQVQRVVAQPVVQRVVQPVQVQRVVQVQKVQRVVQVQKVQKVVAAPVVQRVVVRQGLLARLFTPRAAIVVGR